MSKTMSPAFGREMDPDKEEARLIIAEEGAVICEDGPAMPRPAVRVEDVAAMRSSSARS